MEAIGFGVFVAVEIVLLAVTGVLIAVLAWCTGDVTEEVTEEVTDDNSAFPIYERPVDHTFIEVPHDKYPLKIKHKEVK